jgi:ParB family transcriptional regulator, chromosome partitioning protein
MRRALGKGLTQLIGEQYESAASNELPIGSIVPNAKQPREHFDEGALEELAQSIREVGLLQPIVVRPLTEGKFEVIAGERRLRASRMAGLTSLPVVMRAAGNESALEIALIENLQREDISPLECGRAYRRLIEEFGLTQEQVADKVGKARTSVANTIRLLRLPKRILAGLESGVISEGHARALLSLDSEIMQIAVFDQIVTKGLTVRDAEKLSRPKENLPKAAKDRKPKEIGGAFDPQMKELEDGLSMYFGSPVQIEKAEVGGRLVVSFYSDDDLTRILDVLGIHV